MRSEPSLPLHPYSRNFLMGFTDKTGATRDGGTGAYVRDQLRQLGDYPNLGQVLAKLESIVNDHDLGSKLKDGSNPEDIRTGAALAGISLLNIEETLLYKNQHSTLRGEFLFMLRKAGIEVNAYYNETLSPGEKDKFSKLTQSEDLQDALSDDPRARRKIVRLSAAVDLAEMMPLDSPGRKDALEYLAQIARDKINSPLPVTHAATMAR